MIDTVSRRRCRERQRPDERVSTRPGIPAATAFDPPAVTAA